MLFARLRADERAFWCLGPATYVRHERDRPIAITWRLHLAAVDEIAGGGGRVATIVGPAGAGKTTMLRSVAASYEAAGREVIVLTLSAAAARVVTDETGLAADTIAGWRVGAVDMPRNGSCRR